MISAELAGKGGLFFLTCCWGDQLLLAQEGHIVGRWGEGTGSLPPFWGAVLSSDRMRMRGCGGKQGGLMTRWHWGQSFSSVYRSA